MNNNIFGAGGDLRESLRARGYKTAGELKAEGQANQTSQPEQKATSDDNDKIAQDLGNRMLRDLGAFALNPIKGSFKFNEQIFKTMGNALTGGGRKGQMEKVKEEVQETPVEEPVAEEPKEEEKSDEGETIEYTYKDGDTFGQVIRDLGLESGNGLWGDNGDVEYYSQQLMDQGIWPNGMRGNIPVGTTIKLKQRPMTQEMIEYRKQYGYN